jgi:hypothetical protein
MRPVRPVTAGMTDDEPKHLCDACGEPIGGEHFTDEQACGTGDGPGFFLCGDEDCVARRPKGIRARRQFYAHQRAHNNEQHSYTANSTLSFHVEMGQLSEDDTITIGDLFGDAADGIETMLKSDVDKMIDDALADWVANHVSSGWSIEE